MRLYASVSTSLGLACLTAALAQQAPEAAPAGSTALDDISVTATRQQERVVDSLASVSVINRQEIRRQNPQRLGSTIAQTPGVAVQENPNDPATAINIRGLQDFGRVAVTVDGARQNFQRSGHNANGSFFLDPAFVRSIDITRGPVANLYGSGAIGGVVSFETIDPKDILRPREKVAGEFGVSALAGRQRGYTGTAIGAFRPTDWASALVGLSFRDQGNFRNGASRTVPDSGQELGSGLAKLVLTPGDGHTLKLSGQYQKYDFVNGIGSSTTPRRTNDVETTNLVARYSFSRPDNDWLNVNASVYRTTTDTRQVRVSGTPAQIGNSRFFKIATTGLDAANTTRFAFGGVKLATTYGFDLFEDHVRTFDPASNGDETTPGGRRLVYGGYVQQHLNWSMVDVIGALRYDGYRLEGGNNRSDGQRLSPKITLGITPIQGIQPYVTYAEGYRAPAITETLVNGLHPGGPFSNFTFVPNPNLRPELGRTMEAGLNLRFDNLVQKGDTFRGKVSVYENRVKDYIEGRLNDPGNDCGVVINGCNNATYGYANVSRARLRGLEAELAYDARRWFVTLAGSTIRGDNLATGQPLESVSPDKIILGAGMRFLDEKLLVGGRLSLVDRQRRLPASAMSTASKAYALVDIYTSYEFMKDTRAFAQIDNLGDVRYRRFRDGEDSPGLVAKFGLTTRLGM